MKKEVFIIETFEDEESLGVIGYKEKYGRAGYSWKYVCANKKEDIKTNRFNPMEIINEISELQKFGYEVICNAGRVINDSEFAEGIVEKCGNRTFASKEECLEHEEKERLVELANEMLRDGKTLNEINLVCHIWSLEPHKYVNDSNSGGLPEYLLNVTKDNYFVVSHWQGCKKPIYSIQEIYKNGDLLLAGVFGDRYWHGFKSIYDTCFKKAYTKTGKEI